ncbi:hypothetical protein [Bacillus altitudinis]
MCKPALWMASYRLDTGAIRLDGWKRQQTTGKHAAPDIWPAPV